MEFIEKKQKGRVPVSTHLTVDEYDQYIRLIAGKVTVAEATRQLVQEFIKKSKTCNYCEWDTIEGNIIHELGCNRPKTLKGK